MGGIGTMGWPDLNQFIRESWGWGGESVSPFGQVIAPQYKTNPPYSLDDFLLIYPQFFGRAVPISGCGTTGGSNIVTVGSTDGLAPGQFLQGPNLPKGTFIDDIGTGSITVTTKATADATGQTIRVFTAQPVPAVVMQLYLNLAFASINIGIFNKAWRVAMSLYIAHYLTLWAKSTAAAFRKALETIIHQETPDGAIPGTAYIISSIPPGGKLIGLYKNGKFLRPNGVDYTLSGVNITLVVATIVDDVLSATWPVQIETLQFDPSSPAQIAAAGLAWGIMTSKAVGDVSASYKPLESLTSWGAWNLTLFGQQLVTMGNIYGWGMLIW